jgi:hypothetical protein
VSGRAYDGAGRSRKHRYVSDRVDNGIYPPEQGLGGWPRSSAVGREERQQKDPVADAVATKPADLLVELRGIITREMPAGC